MNADDSHASDPRRRQVLTMGAGLGTALALPLAAVSLTAVDDAQAASSPSQTHEGMQMSTITTKDGLSLIHI